MTKIRAIVFDLDGVLCDCMSLHEEAFCAAVRTAGIDFSVEEHQEYAGLPSKQKLHLLVEKGRVPLSKVADIQKNKQALTKEYIVQRCHPDSHRRALLAHLTARGYRLGGVTNGSRLTTLEMLARTQLLPYLPSIVTNEDVREPKPAPEAYQQACTLLETPPEETLVIEDHPRGVEAARRARCHVAQLPTFAALDIGFVEDAIMRAEYHPMETT